MLYTLGGTTAVNQIPGPNWIPRKPQARVLLGQREVEAAGQQPPGLSPVVAPVARRLLGRYQWHDEVDAMESRAFAEMLHSGIRPQGPRRWCRCAVLFQLNPKFGLGSCPGGLFVREGLEGLGGDSESSYLPMD